MMAVMIVEQVQDGHWIPSLVAIVVNIMARRHGIIHLSDWSGGIYAQSSMGKWINLPASLLPEE